MEQKYTPNDYTQQEHSNICNFYIVNHYLSIFNDSTIQDKLYKDSLLEETQYKILAEIRYYGIDEANCQKQLTDIRALQYFQNLNTKAKNILNNFVKKHLGALYKENKNDLNKAILSILDDPQFTDFEKIQEISRVTNIYIESRKNKKRTLERKLLLDDSKSLSAVVLDIEKKTTSNQTITQESTAETKNSQKIYLNECETTASSYIQDLKLQAIDYMAKKHVGKTQKIINILNSGETALEKIFKINDILLSKNTFDTIAEAASTERTSFLGEVNALINKFNNYLSPDSNITSVAKYYKTLTPVMPPKTFRFFDGAKAIKNAIIPPKNNINLEDTESKRSSYGSSSSL